MKKYLVVLAILVLAGCAATQRPDQMVFQAKAGYAVTLSQAVTYKELPECGRELPGTLCSKPEIIKQLQLAQATAKPGLDAAEAAVRGGSMSKDIQLMAVRAAQAALAAFEKVLEGAKGGSP